MNNAAAKKVNVQAADGSTQLQNRSNRCIKFCISKPTNYWVKIRFILLTMIKVIHGMVQYISRWQLYKMLKTQNLMEI
jgi:hypothetical protein